MFCSEASEVLKIIFIYIILNCATYVTFTGSTWCLFQNFP
uniref:Uncharacterized protein n=1 Tax=Anguilla anguilla TaxID=7936 RepID=A0A0E9PM99_ANGAN